MIDVAIRSGSSAALRTARAKLDSGADLSGLPRELIETAGLLPERTVRVAGFLGELTEVAVYRFDVEIDSRWLEAVEGIATRRPYVILGRNVLRGFVLRLDGPRAALILTAGARH
jgi:predicted aspartyl protease